MAAYTNKTQIKVSGNERRISSGPEFTSSEQTEQSKVVITIMSAYLYLCLKALHNQATHEDEK